MNTVISYTNYYNDAFSYKPSSTIDFVIKDIKPAYSLFLESMKLDNVSLESYSSSDSFNKNYENARIVVDQYVRDVYSKSPLVLASKVPLMVFVAKYKKNTYVIKGEFVLRVINDFILKKIELGGLTYDKFMSFVVDNTAHWQESIIEMQETTLELSRNRPMKDYIYLLDRYETYDADFMKNVRSIVDVFLF